MGDNRGKPAMGQGFKNIAIIHPAAIGDVMFGTPVAGALKENFPDARLTYWTHESLFSLLELCPSIDAMTPFNRKAGIFAQRGQLAQFNADLIVDLVGSTRTKLITLFNKATVLTHNKRQFKQRTNLHIVDSLFSTLAPLKLNARKNKYPTLKTDKLSLQAISEPLYSTMAAGKQLVALVPSVGTLRPHRAWPVENWIALVEKLKTKPNVYPLLVGGKEDMEICQKISTAFDGQVISLAGNLSLPQTATVLASCSLVVSADTGPAHLAVAVGTPVIGIYGPTLPARNGPYTNIGQAIDNCSKCKCRNSKFCLLTPEPGPGACMQEIQCDTVWARVTETL
ncbi:MAG: glycosyltransferase family 9 protein [Candidatus Obscuribacterales bacterium]|nr:glycosyltransferase family 9 protein [Candidatus Obscuribacterales bacterium]